MPIQMMACSTKDLSVWQRRTPSHREPIWQTIARASVLEPHRKALIRWGALDIAVVQQADALYAFSDSCPHSGASLCSGKVEGGHIQCPAHGLRFRLTDGLLAGSPAGSEGQSLGVRTYPVRTLGEDLQIALQP